MDEYAFDLPSELPPGRVLFEVTNVGEEAHALTIIKVPDGMPPILQQLRGEVRRPVPTLARLAPRGPGEQGMFALDLAPGRYAVMCFVDASDGESHAVKGMAREFRVGQQPT